MEGFAMSILFVIICPQTTTYENNGERTQEEKGER